MPQNIVICSDGTGNVGGKAEGTNVWRLFLAVDQSDPPPGPPPAAAPRKQIAFYDDGVGTDSFKVLRLLGGAFGWGISRNLERLYGFLIQNYQPGDDLYLFGFSRGEFTVRVLSDMISLCGIAKKLVNENTPEERELSPSEIARLAHHALVAYKNQRREWLSGNKAQEFLKNHSHKDPADASKPYPFPIKCLGVWDTVDAVGLPFDELTAAFRWFFPLRFRDLHLSGSVRHAFQALSVDEARQSFQPVMWEPPTPGSTQTIEQVWFSGVHANVGGGYPKDQLALISLNWMMRQAELLDLRFDPSLQAEYRRGANVQGKLYDSRAGLGAYYRYKPRRMDRVGEPTQLTKQLSTKAHLITPTMHVSVLQRIAGGIDGYAPTGIPDTYTVDRSTGGVAPPAETAPQARLEHMRIAFDLIWWRQIAYYLFLVWTFWILYCGWVLSFEPVSPSPCPTTTVLEAVRSLAPWKLDDVVVGYEKHPGFLGIALGVYAVLLYWSASLRTRTQDVAVAAWRLGFGHPVSPRARRRGFLSWVARPFRTIPWIQSLVRFFRQQLVPPLTLVLVFVALFGRVLWFEWSLPKPNPSSSVTEMSGGKKVTVLFDTTKPYDATGCKLVKGERYSIMVEEQNAWLDDHFQAAPDGLKPGWTSTPIMWAGIPWRRVVQAPWYQLRGEIGTSGHVSLAIANGIEFEATETGELFLFVNDVPGCYGNNHGTAAVTIVHLSRDRAP